jgi:4-amino-4-deoxy-L-arabinose transferase-like glycosyltransferase
VSALLLWLVARVLAGRDPRLWLLAGLVLGIGLETKYTVAGLAVALAAGLLLTPARRARWRRLPSHANGQLAVAHYIWKARRRLYRGAYSLEVLSLRGDRIEAVTAFVTPDVFPRFGLPAELPESPVPVHWLLAATA